MTDHYVTPETDRIVASLTRLGGEEPHPDVRTWIEQALERGVTPRLLEYRLRKSLREKTGIIQRARSRRYGVWVSIYEAAKADLDTSGGPYVTICEEHGTVCNHEKLMDAKRHAPDLGWCEDCQEG